MERNTKRKAAGEARREWRKAWGLIRCDGDPKTPMEDIALDAWEARRRPEMPAPDLGCAILGILFVERTEPLPLP